MTEVLATVIRRRVTKPLRTPSGLYEYVDVTYTTAILSPEVLHINRGKYTKEFENEVIINRIKERMGTEDLEVTIQSNVPEVV